MAIATAASRIRPMKASDAPFRPRFFFDRGAPAVAGPPVFCRFVRFRFFDMAHSDVRAARMQTGAPRADRA